MAKIIKYMINGIIAKKTANLRISVKRIRLCLKIKINSARPAKAIKVRPVHFIDAENVANRLNRTKFRRVLPEFCLCLK